MSKLMKNEKDYYDIVRVNIKKVQGRKMFNSTSIS